MRLDKKLLGYNSWKASSMYLARDEESWDVISILFQIRNNGTTCLGIARASPNKAVKRVSGM